MLSHKIEIWKEINLKKGWEMKKILASQTTDNKIQFVSNYIFGKNVSVTWKISVGSDIHHGNLCISDTLVKKLSCLWGIQISCCFILK